MTGLMMFLICVTWFLTTQTSLVYQREKALESRRWDDDIVWQLSTRRILLRTVFGYSTLVRYIWYHVCCRSQGHLHLTLHLLCSTYVCTCVHTYGSQMSILGVFLFHAPPSFLRQGVSLNPELTDLARLASQWAPMSLHLYLTSSKMKGTGWYAWIFTWILGTEFRSSCFFTKRIISLAQFYVFTHNRGRRKGKITREDLQSALPPEAGITSNVVVMKLK